VKILINKVDELQGQLPRVTMYLQSKQTAIQEL